MRFGSSMTRRLVLGVASILMAWSVLAKDQPPQVVMWPDSGPSLVRFSFGKLKEIASIGNRHSYLIDTTAENLWGKVIPRRQLFSVSVRQE